MDKISRFITPYNINFVVQYLFLFFMVCMDTMPRFIMPYNVDLAVQYLLWLFNGLWITYLSLLCHTM